MRDDVFLLTVIMIVLALLILILSIYVGSIYEHLEREHIREAAEPFLSVGECSFSTNDNDNYILTCILDRDDKR